MIKVSPLLLGLALAVPVLADSYSITQQFPIGGDASRWDYLTVDPATRYLYVAHWSKFEVLNVDTGARIGEVGPGIRAHGVVIVPELHKGFASFGNSNAVVVFDPQTLKITNTIKVTGKNPDAVQYDALDTKKVYAVNGASGLVDIIDPASEKIVGSVKLVDGKLEQIVFDGRGRAFVNNEEKSCVHVFDTHTLKVLDTWSLAPGDGGTGAAIDTETHRLFSVCGNNKMIVLDSDTGKVVATPEIGEDPDGVVFDPKTKRIYSSNSDNTLTILHEDSPDSYSLVASVKTDTGAKQLAVDFGTGKIYLPAGKFGPKPDEKTLPPVIPGSFKILVVSP